MSLLLALTDGSPPTQTLVGALFSDPDFFPSGQVNTSITLGGTLFVDADAFPGGSLSASIVISGALFMDPDTFFPGTLSGGGGTGTAADWLTRARRRERR